MPGVGLSIFPSIRHQISPSPPISFGKYYDFKIVSSAVVINPGPDTVVPMDGIRVMSYDYLNTGTKGILSVRGWPGVSIKSIFYSQDNGPTVDQMTDFPGAAAHSAPGLIECSDGSALSIGGDKNDVPYGSNQMYRYIKNLTPSLQGAWNLLTANMGSVWGDRIMCRCWNGGDGYIYAAFGQLDNSGTPFYNIIRIPELTLTGEDWEVVLDCTAFFVANSITALSDYSLSFDGSSAILTGGLLYTGVFATNVYNSKVIKISNHGTSISITGTLNSGAYSNGNYYDGKHWVQFGSIINLAHDAAPNTKGLSYSDDLGATWTENYNGPGARHAGELFNHFDTDDNVLKMYSAFGNLWNSIYSIQAKEFSAIKPNDLWKKFWLFYPTKLSDTVVTAVNNAMTFAQTNGIQIDAFWSSYGTVNSDQRARFFYRSKDNLTNPDAEDYKTPRLATINSSVINNGGNAITIQATSTPARSLMNWNISRDAVVSSGLDSGIAIFPFTDESGGGGADVGYIGGSDGAYIFLQIGGGDKWCAMQSTLKVVNSLIAANKYHEVVRKNTDEIEFTEDTTTTVISTPYIDSELASSHNLGGAGLNYGKDQQGIYLTFKASTSTPALRKQMLVNFESDLNITR